MTRLDEVEAAPDVELLRAQVVSYDGALEEEDFAAPDHSQCDHDHDGDHDHDHDHDHTPQPSLSIRNTLLNNRERFHCSKPGANFDLVLRASAASATPVTLTHVVVRIPPRNVCSSPLRTGVVFVHDQDDAVVDVSSYTRAYDNMTADEFAARDSASRARDHAVAYFTVPGDDGVPTTTELVVPMPRPLRARFVHIKFISAFDTDNIDLEFIGLIGWPDATRAVVDANVAAATGVPAIPERLNVLRRQLKEWNELVPDFMPHILRKPSLIVLGSKAAHPSHAAAYAVVRGLAAAHREALTFYYCDDTTDAELRDRMRDHIGLPKLGDNNNSNNTPTLHVVIIDLRRSRSYILGEGDNSAAAATTLTRDAVDTFCQRYRAGTLVAHVKSAARPPNDADPARPGILVLTAKTFDELVVQPIAERDVLVYVSARWCDPCRVMTPAVHALARLLHERGVQSVRIAELDAEANDMDPVHLAEEELPVIKMFFPRTAADAAAPAIDSASYGGGPVVRELLAFVHANLRASSAASFDLAAAQAAAEPLDADLQQRMHAGEKMGAIMHAMSHTESLMPDEQSTLVGDTINELAELLQDATSPTARIVQALATLEAQTAGVLAYDKLVHEVEAFAMGIMRKVQDAFSEEQMKELGAAMTKCVSVISGEDEDRARSPLTAERVETLSGKFARAKNELLDAWSDKIEAASTLAASQSEGKVVHVTDADAFDQAVAQATCAGKLVLVDFTASWCGPCRGIAPFVAQLSVEHEASCVMLKVDVDEVPSVAERFDVNAMPTFVFLRDGHVVDDARIEGAVRPLLVANLKKLLK